ncbi:hypothetical protein C0993_001209 [Termitomyces sp. T159_Od127]|nr:hypothetical protein C0993_001209 [Termitomyces sp. T159_Od127]
MHLRTIEDENNLEPNSITSAAWLKAAEKRDVIFPNPGPYNLGQGAPEEVHRTAPAIPPSPVPQPGNPMGPSTPGSPWDWPHGRLPPPVAQPRAPKRTGFSTLDAFLGLGQSATPSSSRPKRPESGSSQ